MAPKDVLSDKPLIDKLGVKPGIRVAVINIDAPLFLASLRERADVVVGEVTPGTEMAFLGVDGAEGMARLRELRDLIARDGAVWVINPRGLKGFNSNDVMRLGRRRAWLT
ncbi:MAG: hypothetical protein WD904_13335 [Dehalococcoidia bacterium]